MSAIESVMQAVVVELEATAAVTAVVPTAHIREYQVERHHTPVPRIDVEVFTDPLDSSGHNAEACVVRIHMFADGSQDGNYNQLKTLDSNVVYAIGRNGSWTIPAGWNLSTAKTGPLRIAPSDGEELHWVRSFLIHAVDNTTAGTF